MDQYHRHCALALPSCQEVHRFETYYESGHYRYFDAAAGDFASSNLVMQVTAVPNGFSSCSPGSKRFDKPTPVPSYY